MAITLLLLGIACRSSVPEPVIVEREVFVEREVIVEVPVEKQVVVFTEVPVEVIKEVLIEREVIIFKDNALRTYIEVKTRDGKTWEIWYNFAEIPIEFVVFLREVLGYTLELNKLELAESKDGPVTIVMDFHLTDPDEMFVFFPRMTRQGKEGAWPLETYLRSLPPGEAFEEEKYIKEQLPAKPE